MVNIYGVKLLDETPFLEMKGLLLACLPQEVNEAASLYKYPSGVQRKILGNMLLRAVLSRDYSVQVDDLKIGYTPKEKPFLSSHPHFHYNISHSGEWVVIAFSNKEVGVDVEKVRKINLNIARRFFSEEEKQQLFSFSEKKQLDYFFDLWTLKESFLKALGTGLTKPLKSFTVQRSEEGFCLSGYDPAQQINLKQIKIDRNYKLSVCSFGDEINEQFSPLYINDLLEILDCRK